MTSSGQWRAVRVGSASDAIASNRVGYNSAVNRHGRCYLLRCCSPLRRVRADAAAGAAYPRRAPLILAPRLARQVLLIHAIFPSK